MTIKFNVSEENMKNKNYDLSIITMIDEYIKNPYNQSNEKVKKNELERYLMSTLDISRYKFNVILKTLLNSKVISKDNDFYYLEEVDRPYIELSDKTARFFMDALSPLCFKVYCYLVWIKNKADNYVHKGECLFTVKEIVEGCGYSVCGKNYALITEMLETLKLLKFVECSDESVTVPGFQGYYKELYEVNEYVK